jgi:hypothetical protein
MESFDYNENELPERFRKFNFNNFLTKYLEEFDIIYSNWWTGYSDAAGLLILYHRKTKKYYEQTYSSSPYGNNYDWDPEEISFENALKSMEEMEKQTNSGDF